MMCYKVLSSLSTTWANPIKATKAGSGAAPSCTIIAYKSSSAMLEAASATVNVYIANTSSFLFFRWYKLSQAPSNLVNIAYNMLDCLGELLIF